MNLVGFIVCLNHVSSPRISGNTLRPSSKTHIECKVSRIAKQFPGYLNFKSYIPG